MKLKGLLYLLSVLPSTLAAPSDKPDNFGPTLSTARRNGPQIFNAIHNAMREFGSAWHHNGMSMFPATVPGGTLLYHGTTIHGREVPESLEWLAFELEHAENFARPRLVRDINCTETQPFGRDAVRCERHQEALGVGVDPPRRELKGYLHIYQASRPLKLLYLDGMSAGKTLGTADVQDYIMAGDKYDPDRWGDFARARVLCEAGQEWGIDGFIRMEIGFEIIFCDFTDGLKLLEVNEQASLKSPGHFGGRITLVEWARAAATRYQGIGGSRVKLDYSSVVSTLFYDVNITNPDPERQDLPRLVNADTSQTTVIKEHISGLISRAKWDAKLNIDWQGVTDMIVSRFAERLTLLAETKDLALQRMETNNLLSVFIDYAAPDIEFAAAIERCIAHYLRPVKPQTPEDHLVHAAISSTTTRICTALFKIRNLLVEDEHADQSSVTNANRIAQNLKETLDWAKWKECGACNGYDEVCFIAMFPYGIADDHFNPKCLNSTSLEERGDQQSKHSYWWTPGFWVKEKSEVGALREEL